MCVRVLASVVQVAYKFGVSGPFWYASGKQGSLTLMIQSHSSVVQLQSLQHTMSGAVSISTCVPQLARPMPVLCLFVAALPALSVVPAAANHHLPANTVTYKKL
jgi:hypothetical protein